MKVISGEFPVFFDVDNTLVRYRDSLQAVKLVDPYDSAILHVEPIRTHVKLLKRLKKRGATIVVWSMSGAIWAEMVVKSLGLEDYVDAVVGKPTAYVDDKDVNEWIGKRTFIEGDWGR